jgi:hypothetical protein
MLALRYAYVLALVVWLGGIVILGALVAPTTFQVLPQNDPATGRELAGQLFGTVIARFHYVEYASAAVLLLTLAAMAVLGPRPRAFAVRCAIVLAMLGVALYSDFVVLAGIDAIQEEVGTLVSRLPADDARRVQFDLLHERSMELMLVDLAGALVLLYWEARE